MIRDIELHAPPDPFGTHDPNIMNPVAGFYAMALPKVDGGEVKKIIVELQAPRDKRRSEQLIDLLVIREKTDFEELTKLTEIELSLNLLQILHFVLRRVASARSWPLEPFEKAYECALKWLKAPFVTMLDPKLNRSRKISAELVLEWTSRKARLSVLFKERTGKELRKILVVEAKPSGWDFYRLLGKLKWEGEDTVRVSSKSGEKQWRVNISDENARPISAHQE